MMMRMLEAGGMPLLVDHIRGPDDDNPNGYYEFEPVKQTKDIPDWLAGSEGKGVKMVYRLLYDLPADRNYRVLFMKRRIGEVLASQHAMLKRQGVNPGAISDEQIGAIFKSELERFRQWLVGQSHIAMIDVDYNRMQQEPRRELFRVNEFLGGELDVDAMANIVDRSLYRNRT